MNTEEILLKLENAKYESLGFPAIMLLYIDNEWKALLRNEKTRTDNSFTGKTPKEALQKLYNYCLERKYI